MLKYQIDEIEKINPVEDEEEELATERVRLANSEKLYELADQFLQAVNDRESSASSLMASAYRDLTGLVRLDESLQKSVGEFETIQLGLEEMIRQIQDYKETLSFDPERLKEIETRLSDLELLKRKYGGSLSAVCAFLSEAKSKYDKLVNGEVHEKDLHQKMQALLPELKKRAKKMTEKRKKAAGTLKKQIEAELGDLGISGAEFECVFAPVEFGSSGAEEAEFQIRLNIGQPLNPLHRIVSAGEVSRVMLAIKKAMMEADPIPTLIFDEIDANIGRAFRNNHWEES